MKKILFAIAIVIMLGLTANAQGKKDAFFNEWDNNNRGSVFDDLLLPTAAGMVGGGSFGSDQPAPLGSGLVVLTALGAGYAVVRKRKK